jgi:hypothetical protein
LRTIICFLILCLYGAAQAQDTAYARQIIRTLTADEYHGRGYVKKGDQRAAGFIEEELRRLKLQPLDGTYRQYFSFPVNVICRTPELSVNGKKLIAGKDFIVSPNSPSGKYKGSIRHINGTVAANNQEAEDNVLFIDINDSVPEKANEILKEWRTRPVQAKGYLFPQKKLTWSVATSQGKEPSFNVLKESLPTDIKEIEYRVKSQLRKQHKTSNVIGIVPGADTKNFIFVTAHYDHLGRMGDVIFPGANDNASGISMLLNLAKDFSEGKIKSRYTLVFVAFAGEEAGLIGSEYFTEHPLIPLQNIRFLLNLDLMGTGDEGMMVVNGSVFDEEFALMDSLNTAMKYLPVLGKRGEAKNSDHYHFTKLGVHSFFCYTTGGIQAYHDIYDIAATLPLTRYNEVYRLLRDFLVKLD